MSRAAPSHRPVPPAPQDIEAARAALARMPEGRRIGLVDLETGESTGLPQAAIPLIRRILAGFAAGRAVALIPADAELSTFQAAGLLNVSRPSLVKLLEAGDIPFRRVGTHRRVRLADVLAFKVGLDKASDAAMDELVAQAQDLNMGY